MGALTAGDEHLEHAELDRYNPAAPILRSAAHPVYDRYRAADPVHWGVPPLPGREGAYYLFRYDHCFDLLRDARVVQNPRTIGIEIHESLPPALQPLLVLIDDFLGAQDPPEHRRGRALLLSRAFAPRRIAVFQSTIDEVAADLVRQLADGPDVADLLDVVAAPLPVAVIADILGVPRSERVRFRELSDAVTFAADNAHDPQFIESGAAAAEELKAFFGAMVADRRRTPRDDLLTDMVTAQEEGLSPFSSQELIAVCIELLIAGHETTVSGIANGVIGLLQQRSQWELLCADVEGRRAGATEEILRWTTPLQWLRPRWTKEEIQIGGRTIPAGEPVYPVIAAANRDPEQFSDPHAMDIARSGPRHLGFGHGAHVCIGAALARMEIQSVLTALATRLPGLAIVPDQDFGWRPNGRMPGPTQVLVRPGSR